MTSLSVAIPVSGNATAIGKQAQICEAALSERAGEKLYLSRCDKLCHKTVTSVEELASK